MDELNNQNVKVIENATAEMVREGDRLTRRSAGQYGSVTTVETREGVASYRDGHGDWFTADGIWLTDGEGEGVTLTIRRPIRKLPKSSTSVIVTNDGGEAIEAAYMGSTWRANEAILGADGRWYGVWRRASSGWAPQTIPAMAPYNITPNTWKEDGE